MRPLDIDWDALPLGKIPDGKIAKMIGAGKTTVAKQRRKRGISAFVRNVDWDNQPLGEDKDKVLAEKLGVHTSAVYYARKARGIPPFHTRNKKINIDWELYDLGNVNDSAIAKELGISPSAVGRYRKERKIGPKSKGPQGIDWDEQLLGEEPDVTIATRLGVDKTAVSAARRKRGIKPFDPPFVDTMCKCGAMYKARDTNMEHMYCCEGCRSGASYHDRMGYPKETLVMSLNLRKLNKEIKKRRK